MALKRYDVEINGMKTTLQLSDEDAKLHGLKPSAAEKAQPAPANKASKAPANKGGAKAPSARQAAAAGEAFGAEKSEG